MSFISIDFVLFFIISITVYFSLPYRLRWVYLLAASYFFYAYWNASYLILIVFSTFVDYFVARQMGVTAPENTRARRLLLATSMIVNLGVLFTFKYFNFFSESFAALLNINATTLDLLLPVGISFYTFQSMSYTIDVYRGDIQPERHAGIFATFIAFFPQLVAGPIERAGNMLPQFREQYYFDYVRVVQGFRLILWGFFKKVVIADRLAIYVDGIYNHPTDFGGPALILATLFFAFQIYCDFSGYSDIAIGTARVMGFTLMDNFRQPYFSKSIREFWRRWHISLSTWFRDYLYIPLGGSRVPFNRLLANLMIVFVVSGLWHGANWTFVIWGALHGAFIVIETILDKRNIQLLPESLSPNITYVIKMAFTFTLVVIAWVFFRANSIDDAFYILTHLFDFSAVRSGFTPYQVDNFFFRGQIEFMISVALILVLLVMDARIMSVGLDRMLDRRSGIFRWIVYNAGALAVILSLVIYAGTASGFIYFQF